MPSSLSISAHPSDTVISLLKKIKDIETPPKSLTLDLREASFHIWYDFLVILTRRFPSVHFTLLSVDPHLANIASSFSIRVSRSSIQSEFDKEYREKQANLLKHNYTPWEYFLYEMKRFFQYLLFLIKRRPQNTYKSKLKMKSTYLVLMIFWLIMSLSLLLFIFYFAVSKTIVTISPQISVKPIIANVVFSSIERTPLDWNNVLEMRMVSTNVESTMKFRITTLDKNTIKNSQGVITVFNELSTEQTMKPNTRFVTDDGLVFRTTEWIRVAWAKSINGIQSPGMIDISVIADQYDEKNELIGVRWNIPDGTNLTIPWLKFNRDRIYAKSKWIFSWGDNPKLYVVTQNEVDTFLSVFREQLKAKAKEEIQKTILTTNQETGREFSLLLADTMRYSDENIGLMNGIKIGDYTEEVTVAGKMNVDAFVFDKRASVQYLTNLFREKLLHWTDKELAINEDTLRVSNVIDRSEDGTRIKVTIEMNAVTTYDFENATNDLSRQLKSMIVGLSRKEAEERLNKDWHVGKVRIRFSPFWMRSVSSNPDNIEFVIQKTE